MKKKKHYYCSHCKQIIFGCDCGWGHKFVNNQEIICKKKSKLEGSLHFCSDHEMENAIVDPDIPVRTFGEYAKVIYK